MTRIFLRGAQINVAQYAGDIGPPKFVEFPFLAGWITRAAMIAAAAAQTVKVNEALQLEQQMKIRQAFLTRDNKLLTRIGRFPLAQLLVEHPVLEHTVGCGSSPGISTPVYLAQESSSR